MRVGSWVWWVVAASLLAAVGCGSSGGYGGGSAAPPPAGCTAATATAVTGSIEIAAMEFVPSCAKVTAGTTVIFTNNDSIPHTVTSDAGQPETFDSGALALGGTFTHTFASAGTVRIHCSIHPTIRATVIVE